MADVRGERGRPRLGRTQVGHGDHVGDHLQARSARRGREQPGHPDLGVGACPDRDRPAPDGEEHTARLHEVARASVRTGRVERAPQRPRRHGEGAAAHGHHGRAAGAQQQWLPRDQVLVGGGRHVPLEVGEQIFQSPLVHVGATDPGPRVFRSSPGVRVLAHADLAR
ncbi:hypothetical protein GCM10027212_15870 [Actinotalea caeni]